MKNCQSEQIIFLPGWSFKAAIWDGVINSLPEYQTTKFDLPISLNVVQKLVEIVNEQSIIVAWSMSGLFAIDFCYHYPQLCKKLILVNSLPKFVAQHKWCGIPVNLAKRFIENSKQNLSSVLSQFKRLVQFPNYNHQISRILQNNQREDQLINYLEFLLTCDYRDILKSLRVPITAYFGSHDSIIPIQSSHQLLQINGRITVKIFNKAGHIPFLTHKDEFIQSLNGEIHAFH